MRKKIIILFTILILFLVGIFVYNSFFNIKYNQKDEIVEYSFRKNFGSKEECEPIIVNVSSNSIKLSAISNKVSMTFKIKSNDYSDLEKIIKKNLNDLKNDKISHDVLDGESYYLIINEVKYTKNTGDDYKSFDNISTKIDKMVTDKNYSKMRNKIKKYYDNNLDY